MSSESLRAEVEFVLSNTGQPSEAAFALITDFLRALHELMVKSEHDQVGLLACIHAVFGTSTMQHLARVLDAHPNNLHQSTLTDGATLWRQVELNCKQRGFEPVDGRHLLAHFLKALDEERVDENGNIESAVVMLYWGVGHEAAYHLGGLFTGDHRDIVSIELGGYLDPSLKRFYKLVEMWNMERTWKQEEEE